MGQVLDALEKSGEAENTLVIYTSDHGDYMAEHGLWCKGLPCFKGAYHIPAAIRWPKGIKDPGRVIEEFVDITDFAPTILEVSGVEPKNKVSGMSLISFLKNEVPERWRDALFTQSNGNEQYGIQRSVTTKKWKLVHNGYDYDELYNLENDPDQMVNVFDFTENKEIVKELYKKLWSFAYEHDDICINPYIMIAHSAYGPGCVFG